MVYAAGVLVGLWRTDDSVGSRVALSLIWPIGPLAGVVTIVGLVVAAALAPLLRSR